MSDIDPYIEPVELHLFDEKFLLSGTGYTVIKEAYPGSFEDRPVWADAVQEIICCSIQIAIVIIVCIKTLVLLTERREKFLSVVFLLI